MSRPRLEIVDIFRAYGLAWRQANAGHVSLSQLKVMSAIEACRTEALTHHPHIRMIVPGGGLSPDGTRWIACKPGFFLHVRVLSRLFRRLFLEGLMDLHRSGQLAFFGELAGLADTRAFAACLAPFRNTEWVVYAVPGAPPAPGCIDPPDQFRAALRPPFGGPEAVLTYLSRYTHRVAISNTRLVCANADTVAFRRKDYCIKGGVSKACWFALCSCASVRYAEPSDARGDPPCPASIRLNSAVCLPV